MANAIPIVVALATCLFSPTISMSINLLDVSSMEPISPNYCNNSDLLDEAGLVRATLGQFLGYECSQDFYHCRWQSDGFRTYRKQCKTGLVYDVLGTQNCNYDYNVKTCGMRGGAGPVSCNQTDFHCSLSEQCVPLSKRCDGHYDCALEEDEQNCPLCTAGEFACVISEQCISLDRRCNGIAECSDGTDERDCEVCGHGLFHCGKSGECIPIDERCDGRRQCPHGEDEMLCKKPSKEKKFTCQSRDTQIPMNQVCDGAAQCPDGSDEMYCEMGVSAGSSISFSSNPNPPPPAPPVAPQPEEDYDYEEVPDDDKADGPSFPMLSLGTMAPPRIIQTAAPTTRATAPPPPPPPPMTAAPPPQAPVPPPTNRAAFSKPKPRITIPQEMKQAVSVRPQSPAHRILQPTLVEVTAAPAPRPMEVARSVEPSAPAEVHRKRIRYPTKSVSEVVEARTPMAVAPAVQPRTQNAQQMFARPAVASVTDTGRTYEVSPYATPQHAVIVEVTSSPALSPAPAPSLAASRSDLLQKLGDQLNNGMTPEMLAKIEQLLAQQVPSTRRRRPTSTRDAVLSPSAILRTFTSRVQKVKNINQ